MSVQTDPPPAGPAPKNESLEALLTDLIPLKESVVQSRNWYRDHAERPMLLFRSAGVLLILLSVSVPFLSTLEGVAKEVILPIFSLLIAALTGLNAFFQWQSQWQRFRLTQYQLEYLLNRWEFELTQAKHQTDHDLAVQMATDATARLLDRAHEITFQETGEHFKEQQLPSTVK